MIFREFLILISDYYTISRRYLLFDLILPLIMSLTIVCFSKGIVLNDVFMGQIMVLLSIFAGFNTTAISILTSASNQSIERLKETITAEIIGGKKISLFQQLYITISYTNLATFFAIIFCFFGLLLPIGKIFDKHIVVGFSMFIICFILHIMFLHIRNVSFLYFSFFSKQ